MVGGEGHTHLKRSKVFALDTCCGHTDGHLVHHYQSSIVLVPHQCMCGAVLQSSSLGKKVGLHNAQFAPEIFLFPLQAVDLTKLDLSHNRITELPQQLYDLNALVTLLAR